MFCFFSHLSPALSWSCGVFFFLCNFLFNVGPSCTWGIKPEYYPPLKDVATEDKEYKTFTGHESWFREGHIIHSEPMEHDETLLGILGRRSFFLVGLEHRKTRGV